MTNRDSKNHGLVSMADVLGKTLDNLGLLKKMKKYQVFSIWSKVLGDVSRHAKPRRLSGDVLFVATASSAWSQELTFMRQSILDKINGALGGEHVREIRFSEHLWDPSEDCGHGNAAVFPLLARGEDTSLMDSITDQELASIARRFSSTMSRRRQYLLRQGYRVCERCGCLYPSKKEECPYCKVKEELIARHRAIAILDKAPYLPDDEVLALTGSDDRDFVERARRDLESRCLSIARNIVAREARRLSDQAELAHALQKLAALRTGKPAEDLTREEIEKAVGRRLFLAAKKGSAWRHGSTWGPKLRSSETTY